MTEKRNDGKREKRNDGNSGGGIPAAGQRLEAVATQERMMKSLLLLFIRFSFIVFVTELIG